MPKQWPQPKICFQFANIVNLSDNKARLLEFYQKRLFFSKIILLLCIVSKIINNINNYAEKPETRCDSSL